MTQLDPIDVLNDTFQQAPTAAAAAVVLAGCDLDQLRGLADLNHLEAEVTEAGRRHELTAALLLDRGWPTTPLHQELAEYAAEALDMARGQFLAELHDIDFHHYSDGYDGWPGETAADVAAETAELAERMSRAARTATLQARDGLARLEWLGLGLPLLCPGCGYGIDTLDFGVCGGWAEHDYCHHSDPDVEAADRDITRQDAEDQASLMARTMSGPHHGDEVLLTLPDGTTTTGIWLVRYDEPDVLLPLVSTPTRSGFLISEGTTAAPVPVYVALEVTRLGEDWAPEEGPYRADGSFYDPETHQRFTEAFADLNATILDDPSPESGPGPTPAEAPDGAGETVPDTSADTLVEGPEQSS